MKYEDWLKTLMVGSMWTAVEPHPFGTPTIVLYEINDETKTQWTVVKNFYTIRARKSDGKIIGKRTEKLPMPASPADIEAAKERNFVAETAAKLSRYGWRDVKPEILREILRLLNRDMTQER